MEDIYEVAEILEEMPSIVNRENCIKFENFARDITFENVDFKYKDSTEKILKNINLDVKKGETIAFVGNSGGGKSTLVNLIPRFFDVSGGSLKIDGIDIRDYEIKSLRKAIGIVPQETFLFSGTILSNIKYSRQNATFEEIVEAAKQANAHEFIENLSSKIALPILIDDGFVNFDSERKQIMLQLIKELSSKLQVIYFSLDDEPFTIAETPASLIRLQR